MKTSNDRKNYKKRIATSTHAGMASGVSKYRHVYKSWKRIIAFVLALAMVLGLVYVGGKKKAAKAAGGTISFGEGKAVTQTTDASLTDDSFASTLESISTETTILVPVKTLSFTVGSKHNLDEEIYKCSVWTAGTLPEGWAPEVDASNGDITDIKLTDDLSSIDCGEDKAVYFHKFNIVKNEASEWVLDASSVSSVKFNFVYEAPTAPTVSKTDFTYTVSDVEAPENTIYYGSYGYSAESVADTTTELTAFDGTIEATSTASTVSSTLSADGNDGTYIITKKITTSAGDLIYGWQGLFVRDDEIDGADSCDIAFTDSDDAAITVLDSLDPTKAIKYHVVNGSSETVSCKLTVTDTATSGTVLEKSNDSMAAAADLTDSLIATKVSDFSGKTLEFKAVFSKDGKKDKVITKTITYIDVIPTVTLSSIYTTTIDVDGTSYIKDGDGKAVVYMNYSAAGTAGAAKISSSGVTVTPSSTCTVDVDTFADQTSVINSKITISDAPEGKVDFSVQLENSLGVSAETPATFELNFDKEAPEITLIEVSQGSIAYNTPATSDVTLAAEDYKFTSSQEIKFVFTVSDAYSGVNSAKLTLDGVDYAGTEIEPGKYAVEIPADTTLTLRGTTHTASITADDKVGWTANPLNVEFTYIPDKVEVTNAAIELGTNGKKATVGSEDIYNGNVNLVYTIESDVALNKDSILLTANYNGTPDTDIKAKAKSVSLEPTGNTNEYKVTIELAEENSVKFDNINFKIANNNDFYSDVKTISILKIDMTDPEAAAEAAVYVDPTKSIDGEDGWYNTLYLKITYEDPKENGVKSGIESVTVTQDTGKKKTTSDIEVDESKGYSIVKIEDSVSIAGTKVKINAEDKLKHTFETGELTYYVDSVFDGEVGLSVESDGNTISDPTDCVKGDPVITASADDTVGVKDYSIKVTQNGTDVAAYSIPDLSGIKDGTTVNLEDVLTADGKTLDDGEYKINATAKDIAGNTKNASEVSFTLDCNAPAVEDIKLEQTNSADQTISIKDGNEDFTSSVSRRFDLNFTVSGLSDVNLDPAAGKGTIKVTGPNGEIASTYDSSAKTLLFTVSAADMETMGAGTKSFKITAVDAAKNKTERTVKVKLLEDKINVDYGIVNDFKKYEFKEGETTVNVGKKQEAAIEFIITSDSKVTSSDLTLKINGTDEVIDDARFSIITEEDGNCEYTYSISIDGINEKKTFELTAVNNYGVSGKNELAALGFDISDPNGDKSESAQTKHGNDDWYKNLVLVVSYDDSDGLAWYSGIRSIEITGASVKTNQKGVSDFNLDAYIAEHPDKGQFLIDVDESTLSGNDIVSTKVSITVKDKVYRVKEFGGQYKVDKTRPNPVSYQVEVNGNNILETPATKRIFGKDTTDAIITYSMEDNIRLLVKDPYIIVNGPNGITGSYKKSKNVKEIAETVNLSDLVELTDGKYNIVFKSEDLAGNEAKFDVSGTERWSPYSTNIWLDYTNPKLSDITVTQVGNDAIQKTETGYRQLTTASTSESKGEFTLKFNTKDPVTNGYSSKIKTVEIKEEYSDGSETNYYLDDTEITKYKHEFKIQSDERYIGKTVKYTVTVVDGAGNSTSKTFYLSFTTDEIAVTSQLSGLTTDNGTKNNTFDIIYTIKSAAPITPNDKASVLNADNITLTMKSLDGDLDKNTAGKGVLKLADTYDAENSVYDYIYTYTVERTDSDQLTDITMSVKNNNGVVSDEDKITLINIDLRNPYMDLPEGFETNWYQELPLVFNYGDDATREYVSGVAVIKITGVKQALGDFFRSEVDTGMPDANGRVVVGSIGVDVKESESLAGTPVTVEISDMFGRSYTKSYVFHVDETDPDASLTVNDRSASDVNGAYLGGEIANPTVAYQISDNIQVQEYSVAVTLPSGATVTPASGTATNNISNSTTLAALIGASNCEGGVPKDGKYTITLSVKDIAGRTPTGGNVSTTFVVDNTVPLNDLVITTEKPAKFDKFKNSYSNATTNTAYEYGQYYGSDVYFNAVVVEDNVSEFTVTDNGAVIYTGTEAGTFNIGVSAEGEHSIAINTVDKTGLKSEQQVLSFVIDKTPPDVSAALNGSGFAEGGALRYLNSSGDVSVAVSDANVDDDDLTMTVTTTPPNSGGSTSESKIQPGSQVFAQDGEYMVKFVAIDKAGNKSAERSVEFRVDKTPPELKFSGAPDKGTATSSVTMNYIVNEAYYSDMNGCTLRVYKKIDGQGESLLKTVEIKPTGPQYSLSELFQDEGEYRFEMAAEDKCGNKAQASYTFILDGKAPIITLTGVGNYDKTVEDVILGITVDETFFASNKVVLTGTRIDINGEKHKVDFNDFNPNAGKVTTFEQMFKEDGIYDISIESTDKAGNKSSKQLHFTIDRTDPEINGVDDYAGKAVKSFDWNVDADNMVRDLTVCNTSVYMDGVEYDGKTSLKDGTHLLRVVATDELGHTTEKEVSFKLDTTAPNILVSGVEEGQYIKVPTDVKVTVELDEDTLTKATLNGQEIPVNNGVATVRVDSRMAYTLTAEAVDEAGNVSKLEMHFNFGEKFPWWIFLAGAGGVGLIGLVLGLSRKKQKKK